MAIHRVGGAPGHVLGNLSPFAARLFLRRNESTVLLSSSDGVELVLVALAALAARAVLELRAK